MRKLLILILGLSSLSTVQAQSVEPEVVASAGGHFTAANAQLSWTLGEPVIATYTRNTAQLTQGFHQTLLILVAVDEPMADFPLRVYPNPTSGWLNIETQASAPTFLVELSDLQGRILYAQTAPAPELLHTLDLSGYAPGLYLLHLRSSEGQIIQSFKVIKP